MFREVILMSFSCPHCNASNCEIQPGAPLQDKGVRYTFEVRHPQVQLLRLSTKPLGLFISAVA